MWGSVQREFARHVQRDAECTEAAIARHLHTHEQRATTKRKLLPELTQRIEELEMAKRQCRGPQSIPEFQRLSREVERLQRERSKVERDHEWRGIQERAHMVMCPSTPPSVSDPHADQREAVTLALFHQRPLPVYVHADCCRSCGSAWQVHPEAGMEICSNPQCGRMEQHIPLAGELSEVEPSAGGAQTGNLNPHMDNYDSHLQSTCTNDADPSAVASHDGFPSVDAYRKYLWQFADVVEDPPPEVLETIMSAFNCVHLPQSGQPIVAVVNSILKENRDLRPYAFMAIRILYLLRQQADEPQPRLSVALIDRLLHRYAQLVPGWKQARWVTRKRALKWHVVTKLLLELENELPLAELFENHKTRKVMAREDLRMREGCAWAARQPSPQQQWNYARSV